jgi:hypothetical protein
MVQQSDCLNFVNFRHCSKIRDNLNRRIDRTSKNITTTAETLATVSTSATAGSQLRRDFNNSRDCQGPQKHYWNTRSSGDFSSSGGSSNRETLSKTETSGMSTSEERQ